MRSRPTERKCWAIRALGLWLIASSAVWGQEAESTEEAPVSEGVGTIVAEVSTWVAQPSGLDYRPASVFDPTIPVETVRLGLPEETDPSGRYRLGYEFEGNVGEFMLTWWSHEDAAQTRLFTPSNFVIGELAVMDPIHVGVFDDGYADGFEAFTTTRTRDLRLDFYREAFRGKRIVGKWFVGYRRISHDQRMDAKYYAIVPNFPPEVDARSDLAPGVDTAIVGSSYEGRGLEAGLDVQAPIFRDRVWVEAGVGVAALRGERDVLSRSTTHFYAISEDDGLRRLEPPYAEFTGFDLSSGFPEPLLPKIQQVPVFLGMADRGQSADAQIVDVHFEFRWRAWRDMEFFGGFRNTRYNDVAVDVRLEDVVESSDLTTNFRSLSEKDRSIDYEGFYLGMAYRF